MKGGRMIEQDKAIDTVVSEQNSDPWLAVCLSLILSGLGQFYAGRKLRGIVFFFTFVVLSIFTSVLWAGSQPFAIVWAGSLICSVFYIWMLIDAYRLTKRSNTPEFEADRKIRQNPWKVVFFSSLLCGAGYFVTGRKYIGVLAIIIIVLLAVVSNSMTVYYLAVLAVCLHGYKLAKGIMRFNGELIIAVIVIVFIVTQPLMWAAAYALRYSIMETFVNDNSHTMEPTIKEGDEVIGNKLVYRFQKPKVGDIVVVKRPSWDKPFVRRVVAVGGERVTFESAVLYVDGIKRNFESVDYNSIDLSLWPRQYGMGIEYTVPQGQYYVIGNNLAISWDSRTFGAISPTDIVGKVTKIYWPLSRVRVF
jgi:signal peptidase I